PWCRAGVAPVLCASSWRASGKRWIDGKSALRYERAHVPSERSNVELIPNAAFILPDGLGTEAEQDGQTPSSQRSRIRAQYMHDRTGDRATQAAGPAQRFSSR